LNQQFRFRQFPAGNPLANILVVVAGVFVISLVLTLGFFVFLGIAGFILIMAATMSIRGWWYRRKFAASKRGTTTSQTRVRETHRIIEGEYQEVHRTQGRDEQR